MNLDKFRKRLPKQQPTQTGDIRSRFQRAKAIKLAPAPSAIAAPPAEVTAPSSEPAPINPPITPEMPASEKVIEEGGFQIYKKKVELKPSAPALDHIAADDIPRDVDPVPMGADAIEEALRLINAEDEEDLDDAEKKSDDDFGFAPLGIAEDLSPLGSDAIIPGVFGATDKEIEQAAIDEAANKTTQEMAAAPQSQNAPSDHSLNAFGIGQSISHVIKDIVKTEVDHTIDALTRQAVRDALKAHHA